MRSRFVHDLVESLGYARTKDRMTAQGLRGTL